MMLIIQVLVYVLPYDISNAKPCSTHISKFYILSVYF